MQQNEAHKYSPLELKNDICAALELNETCYANLIQGECNSTNGNDMDSISSRGSQQKCPQEHVDMVCGIRARLMEALMKANTFFENNIELLATIASLKREKISFRDEQRQSTEILNGRISCLLEIVREQQENLDRKQETLALKGVWSNLLKVSPDGKVRHPTPSQRLIQKEPQERTREGEETVTGGGGDRVGGQELDDYAANVLTWLSLQCAQEAAREPLTSSGQPQPPSQQFQPHHHRKGEQPHQVSFSSLGTHIDNTLVGISSVSELVEKVGSLFHALDSVTQTTEKENSTMRVKLQEMSAICNALRRERDEKEGEIERWKDAISVLQTDHDYANNQVTILSHENKRLKTSYEAERASSENWRTKCHEILEAVEKTSELTSLHHDHSTSNSTSSSSRGSGGGSGSTRSNYLSSSSSLGGMSPQLLSSASALCSPSTFYSHQQHLFSPPTATISSSQQGTHSNTAVPHTLDSYCNLVEQADVIMQSPPTPFMTDNKHSPTDAQKTSRESKTGIERKSERGRKISPPASPAHPPKEGKVGTRQSPHGDVTKRPSQEISPVLLSTISKTVEPMDPRLLDDSTLYKMLLEAENEIDELSRPTSRDDEEEEEKGDGQRQENEGDLKQKEVQALFRTSTDLSGAIAHGQALMNAPEHDDSMMDKNSPPGSDDNANESPISVSHSHFETSSYNTPLKSPSASKQFSQSLLLKNMSATKSASKEWNHYFTRGGGTHTREVTPDESPYDLVLRRYKDVSPPSTLSSNSVLPKSSSNIIPISPIPLSQGQ